MNAPLRILYLENDLADAELVHETLEADGIACEFTRVEAEGEFATLCDGRIDLILADYTLPAFDGLSALKIVRQHLRTCRLSSSREHSAKKWRSTR